MRKFLDLVLNWLKDVFRADMVWVDRGQGKWVKRRRYHPVLKTAVVVMLLLLAALWGTEFYRLHRVRRLSRSEPPAPAVGSGDLPISGDAVSSDVLPALPGPLPPGLSVDDDEYWIRIDKGFFKLYLYRGNEVDRTYTIAVGKNPGDKERVGDNRTPNGIFTVQSIEDARTWTHDFGDGKGAIGGAYGPWFIRLRTGWQGIGIHGTHDPDSRGSMVSEGCVRMLNDDLEDLKRFAFKSMKVVIEE
jgi:hypothetical protein